MEICMLPEPKLAMTAGASAELRRDPIMLRTAAVATMMLDRGGSALPGSSSSSEAAGTPCAASAWHITGSQDTVAARLTWHDWAAPGREPPPHPEALIV
jgi:hypothetical protein